MAEEDLDSFFSEIKEIEETVASGAAVSFVEGGEEERPSKKQRVTQQVIVSQPQVISKPAERIETVVMDSAVASYYGPGQAWEPEPFDHQHGAVASSSAPSGQASSSAVAPTPQPVLMQNKKFVRTGANQVWEDSTLNEWPENDFRLFVGDLGNEVTTEMLDREFRGKYSSYVKAKVIVDFKLVHYEINVINIMFFYKRVGR
jgi:hypothetical protein